MNPIEAAADRAVHDAEAAVGSLFHRNNQPQPAFTAPAAPADVPAVQPVPPTPTPQENHMTVSALLADAGKAAAALVKHVGVLASNPLIDELVESGLGLVLTPGEITAVVSFIRSIEAERTALAAPVAAGENVVAAFGASGAQEPQQVAAQSAPQLAPSQL